MYTVEELDPYRDLPPLPPSDDSVIASFEFEEDDDEVVSRDGFHDHRVERSTSRVEERESFGGRTRTGRRMGDSLSAQVSLCRWHCQRID